MTLKIEIQNICDEYEFKRGLKSQHAKVNCIVILQFLYSNFIKGNTKK